MKLKGYLNLVFLLVLCSSLKVETFTRQIMDQFKHFPDYNHHFVFFHQPTLDTLTSSLQKWDNQYDIKFYTNDCHKNKLPECDTPETTPFLLIYNRVMMRYNSHINNYEDMAEWIESRIVKNARMINSKEQLQQLISKTPNVFCFCAGPKSRDDQATFSALSKSLPFLNYCIIQNQILYGELGLKTGNLTFIKNETSNRVEFEYPNRLNAWQWFIKSNMLHTLPRVQALAEKRFQQKPKNLDVIALTCDLSFTCEKVWSQLRQIQSQLTSEALGFNFSIALQDQQESFTFNLYYHLSFNMTQLPALIHVNLQSDTDTAGTLVRHIEYISSDFSIDVIKQFRDRALKGQYKPFYFSDSPPKKKGFTGKGSQKFIQKLVASNVQEVVQQSSNHYILLLTALEIGCSQCETFYQEYKQIAALLKDKDVTFGLLNVNKNEVPIQQVSRLPELLLYKKDDKAHPIRLEINHSFDHLRNFLRDNLGNSYSDPDEL